MRPTFQVQSDFSPDQAIEHLQSNLDLGTLPIVARRAGQHMTLTVTVELQHFWSPWMNLDFIGSNDSQSTTIHARFSPAPSLWTGFMMVYLTLIAIAFFAAMYAAAQWMMDAPPTLLWVSFGCAVACGVLWWISWVGQKLAQNQMHLLRHALEQDLLSPPFSTPLPTPAATPDH